MSVIAAAVIAEVFPLRAGERFVFFKIASERYPQHFAAILLGAVTRLRPSSLYALRTSGGPHAAVVRYAVSFRVT